MPTKDEVREFINKHVPGKPKLRELPDSFWVEWEDVSMYIHKGKYLSIRHSIVKCDPDQARELDTQYLEIVAFARKVQEFMTAP